MSTGIRKVGILVELGRGSYHLPCERVEHKRGRRIGH